MASTGSTQGITLRISPPANAISSTQPNVSSGAALPALMAGGSMCLLLTTNEFGIVLFIGAKGVNTLPMMVYSKAILESDYSVACMIALINILLSLGLFMLYRLAAVRTGVRS